MTEYYARHFRNGLPIDCGANPHNQAAWLSRYCSSQCASIYLAIGSVLSFILSSMLGQASDVYGRKRFLVLSQMVRVGLPFSVMYFLQAHGPLPLLRVKPDRYLSNAFETGGVMNAAATDIVSPDYRATAFDLLSVSIVVGYCSSAFMAPFFARENILQISGGIFILRVVWAIAIVSETLPARTYTNKTRWTAENPISSISILFRNRLFITLMALIALTSVVRKEHPRFKRFI
ncbi:hypothetical protein PC118_g2638 [Phytophthora cactorum]|uniref:Major facilitator superfamily domain n=1 Tax=Phytophthora cactorum TaxID=29920 RepID=A0A8T1GGN3_9STRA|nr:hypothetical protein PC117_g3332 [Phytophthora cactorum]KAG2996132.1 hypothetical protein PC118_g2638 [Phytophthora cactorum]